MALTPKQERFCQNVVSGMSYKDAYKDAYDTNTTDNALYTESSRIAAREDIQDRIAALTKPLELGIRSNIITEREKKKAILWEGIEKARLSGDHNAIARYMDILNKMDSEYLNININRDDSNSNLANLDLNTLKALTE